MLAFCSSGTALGTKAVTGAFNADAIAHNVRNVGSITAFNQRDLACTRAGFVGRLLSNDSALHASSELCSANSN